LADVQRLHVYATVCKVLRNHIHDGILPVNQHPGRSYGSTMNIALNLDAMPELLPGGADVDARLTQDHYDALGAWEAWLHQHDTVPDQPLRTLMPISTRGADDHASNSWSPAVVKLPVYLGDPVEQLASIHAATSRIKNRRRAAPPVDLADLIDLVPPVVIEQAARLYTGQKLSRFHPSLAHVITSNVPGPTDEIYCAGGRVLGLHALAPLCEGAANLNITAVSYGNTFAVGIVACPDNLDDVASIGRGIEDVVGELKAARRVLVGGARQRVASATKPDLRLLGPVELAASDLAPGAAKTSLTCTPAGGKVAQ
jgi:WS/DGAT C-terminal domain